MRNINLRKREDLMNEITKVESSLFEIYNNMQYVEDKDIVDYYVFKLKAEQAKHDFLMKKIKDNFHDWQKDELYNNI